MKTFLTIAAAAIFLPLAATTADATPVCVGRDACTTNTTTVNGGQGGKGGNASASQSQSQTQGQAQSQGQSQSQRTNQANSQSTNVNIDNPWATLGVVLGSSNNSPCGRTFFGIPASGHNCTVRMEAQAIYQAAAPLYGDRRASALALMHLCTHDRSIRTTMVRAGVCKPAK